MLALTAPFCVFGIARFLTLVMRVGQADSPTEEMLRDVPFVANLVIWGISVLVIIYVV
ncbi:phosphoribose diphosphate:decaprenyl-phosphate phosphoribosyltransferase [compost metagenome]